MGVESYRLLDAYSKRGYYGAVDKHPDVEMVIYCRDWSEVLGKFTPDILSNVFSWLSPSLI